MGNAHQTHVYPMIVSTSNINGYHMIVDHMNACIHVAHHVKWTADDGAHKARYEGGDEGEG